MNGGNWRPSPFELCRSDHYLGSSLNPTGKYTHIHTHTRTHIRVCARVCVRMRAPVLRNVWPSDRLCLGVKVCLLCL